MQNGRRRPDGAPAKVAYCLQVHGLHSLGGCSTLQLPAPTKHACLQLIGGSPAMEITGVLPNLDSGCEDARRYSACK